MRHKGPPVVFVIGPTGLVAKSGAKKLLTLADGPFHKDAYGDYSAADGIFWYVNGSELFALDLRAAAATPVLVANDVPADRLIVIARTVREPGEKYVKGRSRTLVASLSAIKNSYDARLLSLNWGTGPLDIGRPLKLVANDWLTSHANRTLEPAPSLGWSKDSDEVPGLSEDYRECADMDNCEDAMNFGASGWKWFVSKFECDGECLRACLLFDPGTKKIAVPAPQPTWADNDELDVTDEKLGVPGRCGPFHFDQTGKYYYLRGSGSVCEIGAACQDTGGLLAGFLKPGHVLLANGSN